MFVCICSPPLSFWNFFVPIPFCISFQIHFCLQACHHMRIFQHTLESVLLNAYLMFVLCVTRPWRISRCSVWATELGACVDCGQITGRYCSHCRASDRVPSEQWAPLCSRCDRRHECCQGGSSHWIACEHFVETQLA